MTVGLLLCALASAGAQTLARKNWAGSGIRVEPWYESAIFYQVDPLTFQDSDGDGFGDLAGLTRRLPYLEQLGVDAVVLAPLPLEPPGSPQPLDPAYGSQEAFAQLQRESNVHHIHVLVELALETPHEQLIATARFWLSRGVAGLRLTGAPPERSQLLRELRAIAGPARILVDDTAAGVATASRHPAPRVLPEVAFDRRLTAAQALTPALLRAALSGANLQSDEPNLPRSAGRLGDGTHTLELARAVAAALLLGRGAPLLYFGQELGMKGTGDPTPMQWGPAQPFSTAVAPWIAMGPDATTANVRVEDAAPDSLLNWYRRLAEVHHGEAAVRTGTLELLPTPNAGMVAWLRRPLTGAAPAVLVVVNLSPYALVTPLSSLVAGRVAGLKVLARSSPEDATRLPVSVVPLEPYGIFVAEVQGGAGLETVVLPPRPRRR